MGEYEILEEPPKEKRARKIVGWVGFVILSVITAILLINSLLCVFVDGYYPTFGKYRLFAIVSDSMEPEIPTGDMIVGYVPESEADITVGTVITYEYRINGTKVLITHRVIAISVDAQGVTRYTTQGDNAERPDGVNPAFSDVVGVYTGNKCGFFGYFFGFLQSSEGAIALIVIALIIVVTAIIVHFVNVVSIWRTAALHALDKSSAMMKDENGEVDLQTLADVLGIVLKEPKDRKDLNRKDRKLKWFVQTGTLPERPYADDLDEWLAMLEARKRAGIAIGAAAGEGVPAENTKPLSWEEIRAFAEKLRARAVAVKNAPFVPETEGMLERAEEVRSSAANIRRNADTHLIPEEEEVAETAEEKRVPATWAELREMLDETGERVDELKRVTDGHLCNGSDEGEESDSAEAEIAEDDSADKN